MKRQVLLFFIALLVIPAHSLGGEIARIQGKGVITVSLAQEYPPFSMGTDEYAFGLDVDLANLFAEHLGVKLKFIRPGSHEQQIQKLLAGESDIIMAAMPRTIERGLNVNFSSPYLEVSKAALVRRDKISTKVKSYFDLLKVDNLRLGVKSDSDNESFARQLFPDARIKGYPTAVSAADAVVRGEIDAMVDYSPFITAWRNSNLEQYTAVTALLVPVTSDFLSFAIRPGDHHFLTWLNLFVDEIRTDGTLGVLKQEYLRQVGEIAPLEDIPNRAEFLENLSQINKKKMIMERRKKFQGKGDNYE